jgi:hypothetical protein
MGTAEMLFPVGVTDITELPYTHFEAIRRAMIFLSFEELPKKDQPPKKIWLDNEKLNGWFERLRREREDGQKPGIDGPIEDPVENDLKMIID